MFRRCCALVVLSLVLLLPWQRPAMDTPAAGLVVARARCGSCHEVAADAPTDPPALGLAPSLRSIARSQPALFEGVLLRPGYPMGGVVVPAAERAGLRAWLRHLELLP